ncbi:YhcH/YjgK/YiaL family protein [Consotaella salsifontis]|uniref:YhcH/YjgK/YiaL family protein n=1 Tax=Consotaella salsifontis TaxID=1365950 RepID=A0A1T4T2G1_9HYPH|nr:YhcH/YjgK/YiaL family protein [Consotaella salsifontis]SKA34622.1 YhcH/YjgK/YiaL family protein [Consotaella salsifontis]
MIFGRIANLANEAPTLPANIRKGLEFIAGRDWTNAEPGRVEIDGDQMFAVVQDYETGAPATKKPEAHARHIDIQFIFSGEEIIGFAPIDLIPPANENFLEERDVQFFAEVPGEANLLLKAGSYGVFYPWDVHRPCCEADGPAKVRKILVKIRL